MRRRGEEAIDGGEGEEVGRVRADGRHCLFVCFFFEVDSLVWLESAGDKIDVNGPWRQGMDVVRFLAHFYF